MQITKNFKKFKLNKIKFFLKNSKLILIFHTVNLKSSKWLKTEQKLKNLNLKCYKIKNKITKKILNESNLINFSKLIKGSLCFITVKNKKSIEENFNKLIKLNKMMPILAVKLNKNLYSYKQINNITTLNYKKNTKILTKTLNNLTKIPYYRFK